MEKNQGCTQEQIDQINQFKEDLEQISQFPRLFITGFGLLMGYLMQYSILMALVYKLAVAFSKALGLSPPVRIFPLLALTFIIYYLVDKVKPRIIATSMLITSIVQLKIRPSMKTFLRVIIIIALVVFIIWYAVSTIIEQMILLN